jgi:hypothetical protein
LGRQAGHHAAEKAIKDTGDKEQAAQSADHGAENQATSLTYARQHTPSDYTQRLQDLECHNGGNRAHDQAGVGPNSAKKGCCQLH